MTRKGRKMTKEKKYTMLITYSFDSDYVAIPCETEAEAKEWLEKYLKEEILTVINESEYEPFVRRHSDTEVELVYETDEIYVTAETGIASYRIIKQGHGFKNAGGNSRLLVSEMKARSQKQTFFV